MVGVTTATIPEDWGTCQVKAKKFQVVVHVSILRVHNMKLDFYHKYITHFMVARVETGLNIGNSLMLQN